MEKCLIIDAIIKTIQQKDDGRNHLEAAPNLGSVSIIKQRNVPGARLSPPRSNVQPGLSPMPMEYSKTSTIIGITGGNSKLSQGQKENIRRYSQNPDIYERGKVIITMIVVHNSYQQE